MRSIIYSKSNLKERGKNVENHFHFRKFFQMVKVKSFCVISNSRIFCDLMNFYLYMQNSQFFSLVYLSYSIFKLICGCIIKLSGCILVVYVVHSRTREHTSLTLHSMMNSDELPFQKLNANSAEWSAID